MPFTYNGIGTKYYGKRELGPDGSYITTEWITLVYIPLVPIGSFRVCPTGKSTNAIVYNSRQFMVKRVPFSWPQIRNIYAVTGSIVAAIAGVIFIANKADAAEPAFTASPTASITAQQSSPNSLNGTTAAALHGIPAAD
ncbi:MAG: hypothetical protein AAFU53_09465 [Cyanobacteria bacterium J06632_3]